MNRAVIGRMQVWDPAGETTAQIDEGAVLYNCRIVFNRIVSRDDPPVRYAVEFEFSGKKYVCPLHRFQPRTDSAPVPAA